MTDSELVNKIEEHQDTQKEEEIQEVRYIKFLVFRIKEKKFALYASEVREIVLDIPRFYVPFTPPYVRGFINRHGEPYTVIDPDVLFEKEANESSTYLILNMQDDHVACMISDIHEIMKVPENDIHLITAEEEEDGFFLGAITSEGEDIFIINLRSIFQRLEYDFETG